MKARDLDPGLIGSVVKVTWRTKAPWAEYEDTNETVSHTAAGILVGWASPNSKPVELRLSEWPDSLSVPRDAEVEQIHPFGFARPRVVLGMPS
jgi:hypothetical protein